MGRTLEPWSKLRKAELSVMSQPSSNMDSVLMAWHRRDQAKKYPMSLWQRVCIGTAFQADVRKMPFLSHQVPCTVMAKMTSALQLTDTDFSHEIKAIQSNEKKNWVIAGLKRNGVLVMGPQNNGSLKYQDEQKEEWCKGMPIGSSSISQDWLKNRMAWIKSGGNEVDEPTWDRIEGAKELADPIEWSYTSVLAADEKEVMKLDEADQPEWVSAGKFQLPLELRRRMAKRERRRNWTLRKENNSEPPCKARASMWPRSR